MYGILRYLKEAYYYYHLKKNLIVVLLLLLLLNFQTWKLRINKQSDMILASVGLWNPSEIKMFCCGETPNNNCYILMYYL